MDKVIVIGIAGGTGSGKSTMIRKIKEEFSDEITILSHDFYYKEHSDIPFEERKKLNYDHPNAFDTDLMIKHIKELTRWRPVERPVYDFTIHNRVDETMTVSPAKVIIVEGILIFENKELLDLFDIQGIYRYRRRCEDNKKNSQRCKREGPHSRFSSEPVSHNS